MTVRGFVNEALHAVPLDEVMRHVERICAYDRYQASDGIQAAAAYVAEAARQAGLEQVTIRQYEANGKAQWWDFCAPVAWTPRTARMEIHASSGTVVIDHDVQPFSIATYSAASVAAARIVDVRRLAELPDVTGAVIVAGNHELRNGEMLERWIAGGALGFVTDALARAGNDSTLCAGRIELSPGSPLFAFSVTPSELAAIADAARTGATADISIHIDVSASMPVVSGVLPGHGSGDEVWLLSHLCHPRPGANDNASGVAALLGAAAVLARMRKQLDPERSIRFLWGPEYLGTAAALHERLHSGSFPSAAINVDMAGEDQSLCQSPFVVERGPDFRPSILTPIAEAVVKEIFAQTSPSPGTWYAAPFLGFSDHALFADHSIARAAVQFCHPSDRFNHSAADTLDKVSRTEMLRSTAAAAALAWLSANDSVLSREELAADWCESVDAQTRRIAAAHASASGEWARRFVAHAARVSAAMLALAKQSPQRAVDVRDDRPVLRRWRGPINIRAMIAALPPDACRVISDLILADKMNYSLLLNFALRVDGVRGQERIIDETSFALQRPLDHATAQLLFDALFESGWVSAAFGDRL